MSRKRILEIAEELLTLGGVPKENQNGLLETAKQSDKNLCFVLLVASTAASNTTIGPHGTSACLHACMSANVQAEIDAAEMLLRAEEQAADKALS